MTGESETGTTEEGTTEESAGSTGKEEQSKSNGSEELTKSVALLAAEVASQKDLITKLREHEKTSLKEADEERTLRKGVEGEFDTFKTEQKALLEEKFRVVAVDAAVDVALQKANVHNVETAKRLLDRTDIDLKDGKANSKIITERINKLQETDPYLFKTKEDESTKPTPPKARRPGEGGGNEISGFQRDLAACKTTKEIQKLLRKHNL